MAPPAQLGLFASGPAEPLPAKPAKPAKPPPAGPSPAEDAWVERTPGWWMRNLGAGCVFCGRPGGAGSYRATLRLWGGPEILLAVSDDRERALELGLAIAPAFGAVRG